MGYLFMITAVAAVLVLILQVKMFRRHLKQHKTRAVKSVGCRTECSPLKRSSLVSVKACHGKVAFCYEVKVLSPDTYLLQGARSSGAVCSASRVVDAILF